MKMVAQQTANWSPDRSPDRHGIHPAGQPQHQGRHRRQRHHGPGRPSRPDRRGKPEVIVVGFDGSDDAIQSIGKGEPKATSLQPVAEMAHQAAIQADAYIKNGKTGKPEKQSIDMVLITPENFCQYKTFAPTGSTEACPAP